MSGNGVTVAQQTSGSTGMSAATTLRPLDASWSAPYRLTAGLVFLFLFVGMLILGSELKKDSFGGDLSRSLITELTGFFLTTIVIGSFIHLEASQARKLSAARRRAVARREASRVNDVLAVLLRGASAFGPHYLPTLSRLQLTVERLDVELTNVWLLESEERADGVLEAQETLRRLHDEILAGQTLLQATDRPVQFPSALMNSISAAQLLLASTLEN